MDFNQKSSSRSSSSVSASELSQYNTHLILALPSREYLTSNYKNYYSSFAQGLMNPQDKKVSLEIPLNTQMKIFAFLFKENYSMSELFSGTRTVGYYGESQTFSIGTQTHNLSLGITLIQVPGTGTDTGGGTDTTAPTASVTTATITTSGNAVVQSTETGTAYLVNTTVSVSNNFTNITGAADSQWNSVAISLANTNTNLPATGLADGTYKVFAVDGAGNLSSASSNSVTVATTVSDSTAPTASVTTATITTSGSAVVQSTETGTAYLVNTTVSVSNNFTSITGAALSQWNSVAISLANTNTNLPATGLADGTYKVYAVDAAANLSSASSNSVTVDTTIPAGTFLLKWGSSGSGDGQFQSPRGVAVDSSANVYVADTNHRMQKFDSSGNFLLKWGSYGTGDGQFNRPGGVAVDSSGNVYVADTNNSRIQKFSSGE